jgi:hypothetical protein
VMAMRMYQVFCPSDVLCRGYFLIANCAKLGVGDFEFCEWLAKNAKVACVPMRLVKRHWFILVIGVFYCQ